MWSTIMNVTIRKLSGLWQLIVGSCQVRTPFLETQDRALAVTYARRVYPGAKILERDWYSRTKGAYDMSDHDEWISYSHWGMFTLEREFSRQSNWSSFALRLQLPANTHDMPEVRPVRPKKRSALIKPSLLLEAGSHTAMGIAVGLAFAFLATHISALGIATLINYSPTPDVVMIMFVGTCAITFGIGATLTGLAITLTEDDDTRGRE
jgi:hypothetical protein